MTSVSAQSESFGSTPLHLLRDAKQGDAQALDELLERFMPYVSTILRNGGLDAEAAREVLQEIVVALLQHLPAFERERRGSFRKYLAQVARSKIVNYQRGQQKWYTAPGDPSFDWHSVPDSHNDARNPPGPETIALVGLVHHELEQILPSFSEANQEAFRRVYLRGEAPHLVRKELGMRNDAMYHAFKRILNRLRQRLGDLPSDDKPAEESTF